MASEEVIVELTRRQLVRYGAAAGVALFAPWQLSARDALASPLAVPTLPGAEIPKYRLPLILPSAMPRTAVLRRGGKNVD